MFGKLILRTFLSYFLVTTNAISLIIAAPVNPTLLDAGSGSNRVVIAQINKPIDAVLEAIMELGGNVLLLLPPRDYEKRDPPDLGTGRSYSGQRTAKVMWGQLASSSPAGPGKRKRSNHREHYHDPFNSGSRVLIAGVPEGI